MYNEYIGTFNSYVKKINKEIFVTAHYEILNIEGNPEKRVKVRAKEWEGMFEKDYTIVLYGDMKFNEKGKPEYSYSLVQEGTSSKCPPDIFGDDTIKIPNDCNMILDAINKFVTI